MRGSRRQKIMELCPDHFTGDLQSFIDEIEGELIDIVGQLQITSIDELDRIGPAYVEAKNLANSLY